MNHPNDPTNPDPTTAAWEEAMSRDFDARVRDLHEAPLDVSSVKGKAHKIRRNRRAAVAGGVLGVAAVITPFALVLGGNGDTDTRPDFAETTAPDASETTAPDAVETEPAYISDGKWHQADGDEISLPEHDYNAAVLWNDQLVATFWVGEVFSTMIIVAEDGDLIDTIDVASAPVVNDSGTVLAWVEPDGSVIVEPGDDETEVGEVEMDAAGETVAWTAAALVGGPDCLEAGGCQVYLNSSLGEDALVVGVQGTEVAAGGFTKVFDVTEDGAVSGITDVDDFGDTCGAIYETVDQTIRWETCNFQVQQFSPDVQYFLGTQSQYDGTGPSRIAIVDAQDGTTEVGSFERDGWTVGRWAWSPDGRLLFSAVENGTWHLMAMTTDGEVVEDLVEPIKGDEFSSSFLLIGS